MRPTRYSVLLAAIVVAGVLAYLVAQWGYGSFPPLPAYAPATLVVLAIGEGYAAYVVRSRLHGRLRATRSIDPIAVARIAALAKASSLVGALALGAYGGLLVYLADKLDRAVPAADARVAGFGAGSALLLTVAALALERSCRVPRPPEEEKPGGEAPGPEQPPLG